MLGTFTGVHNSFCQTVFSAWKSAREQADEAYAIGNFKSAAALYEDIFRKSRSQEVNLRIARSYYFNGHYAQAITWFEKFVVSYGVLPLNDAYYAAESYAGAGKYEPAIKYYSQVLAQEPNNVLMARKVWRLQNIQYLFEDSLHYIVEELNVNSSSSEIAPVVSPEGLIFLSDRSQPSAFSSVCDANTQRSFYQHYFARFLSDNLALSAGSFAEVERFQDGIANGFQSGRISFFNSGKSMAYVKSSDKPGKSGRRTLQLFFAEWKDGHWETTYSFPFNSADYSVTDPSLNENGTVLYFSSDMKGGQGGKDLYRSEWSNGKWSKPSNLADLNTPYDESFPFIAQGKVLYFTSNGHAGMGGRDIFKTDVVGSGFTEVLNAGYPINTHHDDFSFVLDSTGVCGYFSSNRKAGSTQDDIYRVEMDMQTYPIAIEGVIRYKEIGWHDSSELKVLSSARLLLIDNVKNAIVYETFSDFEGKFNLQIPYFSQYKIKVVEENNNESVVSLEVSRHRKKEQKHDIVVVREVFKTNQETR